MGTTRTNICNMALSRIGQRHLIAHIDETSEAASLCRLFYKQCLESIVSECDWPFAQRYQTLALVAENPNVKWRFAYRYPTGYMSVVYLYQDVSGDVIYLPSNAYILSDLNFVKSRSNAFTISSDSAGKLIFTNLENAIAFGTYLVEDENQYDALFADTLAWRLAYEMSISTSKDSNIRSMCRQEYEMALSKAFARAMNEEVPELEPESEFIKARY